MGQSLDHIRMVEPQRQVRTKGIRHATQGGRSVAKPPTPQEKPHPPKRRRIGQYRIHVEGHPQRQQPVEGQFYRVVESALAFAVGVEPAQQFRTPRRNPPLLERPTVVAPERQVQIPQIIVKIHMAGQQGIDQQEK